MNEQPEWNRAVFVADGRPVAVRDILWAAHFRGELEPCWTRLSLLVECERRAAELAEPDEAARQSASEQFRYERDLITAEETERWLEERGLTADDFSDYFLRHCWNEAHDEKAGPEMIDYLSASTELRDLLRVELLLSDEFDRMAVRLSWRFAALQVAGDAITPDLVEAEREHFYERAGLDAAALAGWLDRLGCDPHWLDEMLTLEAAYRRQCAALLTPQERDRVVHSLRMPLTRLELETIDLESLDAAREALLCVREDGATMSEVAAGGRYPHRHAEVVVEDLPPELQQKFLCIAPGEVLEPMLHGDGFQLCRLLRKIEPNLNDAIIRERVERQILTRDFSALAAGHVRWLIAPPQR